MELRQCHWEGPGVSPLFPWNTSSICFKWSVLLKGEWWIWLQNNKTNKQKHQPKIKKKIKSKNQTQRNQMKPNEASPGKEIRHPGLFAVTLRLAGIRVGAQEHCQGSLRHRMPQPFTKSNWNFAWNKKQICRIKYFMPEQWILAPFKSQKFHLSWSNDWFQSSFSGTKDTRGLRNSPSSYSASLEENQVFNYFSLGKFLFKDVLTLAWRWFPGTTPGREHWHLE